MASTVTQATITATKNDSAATVGYSTTDANDSTSGHQVDLSAGRNRVTVTVTAEDTTTTQTHTISHKTAAWTPPSAGRPPTISTA